MRISDVGEGLCSSLFMRMSHVGEGLCSSLVNPEKPVLAEMNDQAVGVSEASAPAGSLSQFRLRSLPAPSRRELRDGAALHINDADLWKKHATDLPPGGRGTIRRMVEGACGRGHCAASIGLVLWQTETRPAAGGNLIRLACGDASGEPA